MLWTIKIGVQTSEGYSPSQIEWNNVMMQKKDNNQILRQFHLRQTRQIIAIAITLFLVLLAAVLYKRPGVFGTFSKSALYGMQITSIAAFLVFTTYNWTCPSCNKSLGGDINRRVCKKCGARLR